MLLLGQQACERLKMEELSGWHSYLNGYVTPEPGWPAVAVFFFQAEDGIRDYKVTGVQTCALPISALRGNRRSGFPGSQLFAVVFKWTQPQRDMRGLHRLLNDC